MWHELFLHIHNSRASPPNFARHSPRGYRGKRCHSKLSVVLELSDVVLAQAHNIDHLLVVIFRPFEKKRLIIDSTFFCEKETYICSRKIETLLFRSFQIDSFVAPTLLFI